MMKRISLILSIVTATIPIHAQDTTINRLKIELAHTKNDNVKVSLLDSLSMYNMFFYHKSDSTFYYCNEYVNLAIQLPNKASLILAYARLSFYYNNTGQYKECLSAALKGMDLSERYHIEDYLSALYYDLTWAYNNLGESREGLKCGLKGLEFLKQNKDPFFDQRLHLYGLIGYSYTNLNKRDSALLYFKKMDAVAATSKERGARVISDWHFTVFYLNDTQQFTKTDSLIADGKNECVKTGDFLLGSFYLFSSQSYLAQHKTGPAIAESREAFRLSVPLNDISSEEQAAGLLNACYEKLHKPDSAYYYLKMEDSLNAVVNTHTNALDVQQSRFDQQISAKEQAAATGIQEQKNRSKILAYVFSTALAFMVTILLIQWRNSKQKRKVNETLQQQKAKVESTLTELKYTQAKLIQREKMASLGEVTAGIAHEIQNPLNFVNNFSELNNELIEELKSAGSRLKTEEPDDLLNDIFQNNEKIALHGKRAEAIVKSMLEHSNTHIGIKQLTDINQLADEYLRLCYNGLLAKNKNFNIPLDINFDKSAGEIAVVPQNMGRVLTNIFNNAFYAVTERLQTSGENYVPMVSIQTKTLTGSVEIRITDNGNGIPESITEKIFQPFFTTKPTGQGTGLGLSLVYDIVVKEHGGSIEVDSQEGKGSTFIIRLPALRTL